MDDYVFVNALERASILDYVDLFEKSYGKGSKFSYEYLKWLYLDNPQGCALGFDAFASGKLVAHYITIPRIYRAGSTKALGLLSVNTATHPDHQRRGLFARLARATYESAAQQGYQFILGVANAQSIQGFLSKLEFEHLGQIGLAVWREPPSVADGHAQLDKDDEWLSWRLANPSAEYFMTECGENEFIINTCQARAVFSIGRVNRNWVSEKNDFKWRRYRGLRTLTPVYPREGNGPLLPNFLMPSPWHVILRPLAASSMDLSKLHFDGLSMDTF
jgi:hypothetical protein